VGASVAVALHPRGAGASVALPTRCCLHARLAVWLGQNLEQSTKKNKKTDSLSCAAVALHAPRLGVALRAHAPVVSPTRCVCTWSVGPEKKTFSTKK